MALALAKAGQDDDNHVCPTHLTDVNLLSVLARMSLNDRSPQSEAVEQQRQTSHAQHDHPRSTWSTQHVPLQRKLYRQVALERETDDEPDRQAAGHVRCVAKQLTPTGAVVHLQMYVVETKVNKSTAIADKRRHASVRLFVKCSTVMAQFVS